MFNTIILRKGVRRLTRREYKKFDKGDAIFGVDVESEELRRWSIDKEAEAIAELAKYRCEYSHGTELIYITEYALEWCECDEDGEFIQGSDYDLAEEKEEYKMTRYGEKFELNQDLMDAIAVYMDGEKREQAHREFAPCSPEDFLKHYCEIDENFEDLLKSEFSIELD